MTKPYRALFLLEKSTDSGGATALITASEIGREDIVRTLLAMGVEINIQSKSGRTALIQATQQGHEGIVRALLVKGAEINQQSDNGATALLSAGVRRLTAKPKMVQQH